MASITKKEKIVLGIGIVLLVAIGFGFYYDYKITQELQGQLQSAIADYQQKIQGVSDALQAQGTLLGNRITGLQEENQKSTERLEELINEVESQSDIKFGELKADIQSIDVKSTDFSAIIDDVVKSVVSVGTNKGQGSGAFIKGSGYIVTNYHVMQGATAAQVMTYDNKVHPVQLIGYDPTADVALLRISNSSYPSLRFDGSDDVKVGEKVIAVGNPGGLSFTVTEGIVSNANRVSSSGVRYVQTDVPINPGNSGGPLISTRGRIVGINTFKLSEFEGIGFAIAADVVDEVTDDIISKS